VSRLSIRDHVEGEDDDEYTYETVTDHSVMSGFKSQAPPARCRSTGCIGGRGRQQVARNENSKRFKVIHGREKAAYDYVLDTWQSKMVNKRCSVQFKCPSGDNEHK